MTVGENLSVLPFSPNVSWDNGSSTGSNQTDTNRTQVQVDFTRAMVLGFTLGAFICAAIVGNIMVIMSVVTNRQLRIPTNYLIVNLAIADLLLSTTVLPFSSTLEIVSSWVFGRIFCDIWAAMDVLCCTASIFSLCAISIDRYIGVRYSLQYPTIVTRKRVLLALLCVWILATVISIGPLLGWKQQANTDESVCNITTEPFYAIFSSLGSFYIPLIVILVMYCRVYVVAKRITKNLEAGVMKERMDSKELTLRIHCRNMHDRMPNSKTKNQQTRSSLSLKLLKFSREKKAAKTLGIVVGLFILCWLPFFTALPLGSISEQLQPPETLQKVIFWLGYFNSCINPVIYPCSSKEFKRAFIRILRCQWGNRRQSVLRRSQFRPRSSSTMTQPRKESMDDRHFINGSQRTVTTITPSSSYRSRSPKKEDSPRGWKHSYIPVDLDQRQISESDVQDKSQSVFIFLDPSDYNGHGTDITAQDYSGPKANPGLIVVQDSIHFR
ncbi:PREDICTED: alpha-1B adrenergic receptor [Nanorana parkeri]|uniref:alpha-1B adrenergic receptor n=1 Tax=Nanorana parkeri TaxID=125878 RepID=UPI000854881F|nr:PREDICTED: alpha-1B adrenergic receptor [Nanorana parkeri]